MGIDFQKENTKPIRNYALKIALLGLFLFNIFSLQPLFSQLDAKADSLLNLYDEYLEADSLSLAFLTLEDLSDIYEYNGDWTKYFETIDVMIDLAKKMDSDENLAECYNCLGIAYCLNGKNSEALEFFQKCLAINQELGKEESVSNSYENMGLVYKDMGKYNEALECQMNSLKIREKVGHLRLPETYSNISQLFGYIGEPDKQLIYLQKAFKAAEKYPNRITLHAILCCEMGEYLMDMNQVDSALVYFQDGLAYCKKIGWKRGISVFLGDLASAYYQEGDISRSTEMHEGSLKIAIEINDCMGICQEYNSLSLRYLEMGKYTKAIQMNDSAISSSAKCEILAEQVRAYENSAEIYEKLNKSKQALVAFKKYHLLNDSLLNLDKQSKILELETSYETEKKEQQIELLSTENQLKQQRNQTYIALIAALLFSITAGVVLVALRRRKNKQYEQELKQQLLRSQMNPHFIFNALGSIQNFMLKNETKKAAGYLNNFASLTRSILKNSAQEFVSLSEEIDMLRNYLELEQVRTSNVFDYHFIYSDDMDTEFINIPPMFIQPFVENAIKHGFSRIDYKGELIIKIEEQGNKLCIEVSDNGKGIDTKKVAKEKKHESMAMNIFSERKKLLEKQLKKQILFEAVDKRTIDPTQKGTLVRIILPIK